MADRRAQTDLTPFGPQDCWTPIGLQAAERYERDLVPSFQPWSERLVDAAAPSAGERILDVACGTGMVARIAAPRLGAGGSIVGIDHSADMLEVAKISSAGIQPAIDWRRGDAEELPFPDSIFDLAVCSQGLHFFRDPIGALREMHRVLVPGGRVALGVWRRIEHQRGLRRIVEGLERYLSPPDVRAMRAIAAPWDREELRDLVDEAGYRGVRLRLDIGPVRWSSMDECVSAYARTSPLGAAASALSAPARTTLIRNLEAMADDDFLDDDGLNLTFESYIVTAHRAER
jgi:SAM-dependent methyltransferase